MSDFDWDGLQTIVDRQAVSGPTADYLAGIYKATLMLAEIAQEVDMDVLTAAVGTLRQAIQDGTL